MKYISILGSSGSIGTQALNFIAQTKNEFKVCGLTVNKNTELLKKQVLKFKPEAVCIYDDTYVEEFKTWAKKEKIKIKVYTGVDGLNKIATLPKVQTVLSSVVGAIGIYPLLEAINTGKNIATANKEALVMAGNLIMKKAKQKGVAILPVDSEHSAIFQCIANNNKKEIKRILLTASGGPFYKSQKDFSKITVEEALNHPTWKMGKKITIDSATLMNKGLEAIEASVLFDIPINKIDIVIHPQSIIHSMVEFTDGCVMAQMSNPDMTLPIQYALTYPNRTDCHIKPLNLFDIQKLEFYKPNFKKFECLNIAYNCAGIGYSAPAVMSAANEVAVYSFINKKIKFNEIPQTVKEVLKKHKLIKTNKIKDLIKADLWARQQATAIIESKKR